MADLKPEPLTRAERLAAVLVVVLQNSVTRYSSAYISDELGLDDVILDGHFDLVAISETILKATAE